MATKISSKKISYRKVHYVVSSHWDREWYQTFQDYRRRLVHLLDRVLDDLESGDLTGPFTCDGQSIILDDYLEIRPERRAQVERFVKTGRLNIGPWFVLPDEWLVSGESIIRNLRLGRQLARNYGGTPSNAGFVCDLFGHIGQLPQIARGFGIKGGLIWRGIEPRETAHILWRGTDGTALPCYRFGRGGYTDYASDVRHWQEPRIEFEPQQALADLKTFLAKEAARTPAGPLIIFDGADHLEYDMDHYRLLFSQEKTADFPYEVVHSTLDDYLDELIEVALKIKESIDGELREAARLPAQDDLQWLIPGVLSSRVWIKQANAECQTLLCQWAEPFSALAGALVGTPAPQGYLDTAWRWLLMNHPHDSICGCSIDEVHEDMKYRFAQSRQIASAQTDEVLRVLAASVPGDIAPNELRVLVANPLTRGINEPVSLTLQIPVEWGTYQEFFGFEPKSAFRIYDADGAELPYQLLAMYPCRSKTRINPIKGPELFKTNDITVALPLKLPALGYTTLTAREGACREKSGPIAASFLPTRHAQSPGLATSERSMANAFLSLTIEANGTLSVTDLRNGETYHRLLTFEDSADIGDGWYHGQAVNDQHFSSCSSPSDVALVQNGPLLAQFRIRTTLQLPEEFAFEKRIRSATFAPLVLDTLVTLRAGVDRIEVTTTVDNRIKDHRLRVLFPTGVTKATTYLADSTFDVVERKIGLPLDNHLGRELAVETTPQQTWTAVAKGNRGLAVISTGLLESAVPDLPERPIALTLFRATCRTVLTDGQPQGQLQGRMTFTYWIMPQSGKLDRCRLCDAGNQLAASFRTAQLRAYDLPLHRHASRIAPASSSLLAVQGGAVVTSVRQVADAMEVRLFNPSLTAIKAALTLPAHPAGSHAVTRVDFESQPIRPTQKKAKRMEVMLAPKEILTLSITNSKP